MPRAHIIGLGKSGMTAARLLKFQDWEVSVGDRSRSAALEQQQSQLEREGITVQLGQDFDPDALKAGGENLPDLIVASPGVPWDVPGLVRARELGLETIGEVELAWRSLPPIPWLGITGTNGKTTTTTLAASIFQAAGLKAPPCGNIGYATCDLALDLLQQRRREPNHPLPHWVIAELSSYQLEAASTLAPQIGIWTTFTPDHLSRHKTMERYFAIKASLLHQSAVQILNGDDPALARMAPSLWPDALWTSTQGVPPAGPERSCWIDDRGWVVARGEAIAPVRCFPMVGQHNQQNLLLACLAAHGAGIPAATIAGAIAQFPGVPHRLETMGQWRGVTYINDSKATNYDAALVGLAAVAAPTILIAGGEAKEGDDQGWLRLIQEKAPAVCLIGQAAPQFAQRLRETDYSGVIEEVGTLEKAVERAATLAARFEAKVVLLSPACASFDQYQNFEQRGDHFRQCCLALWA